MKKDNLYDFIEDVERLYFKTSSRDIEDRLIALSQAYDEALIGWLNRKNLIPQLRDPNVYNALIFLAKLRERHPSNVSIKDMVDYLAKNTSGESLFSISYIISFGKFLNEPSVKKILDPFRDIIVASSRFSGGLAVDDSIVFEDLQTLSESFSSYLEKQLQTSYVDVGDDFGQGKQTKQQKLINMFSYLLRIFSEEMAIAAQNNELEDFANGLRQGILAKPPPLGISKYMYDPNISDDKWYLAQKLANYVVKNSDNKMKEYNHDLVEITLLNAAGQLTREDIYKFKEKVEEAKNVARFMEEGQADDIGGKIDHGITIMDDNRLNPEYIYMLSIFFVVLYRQIDPRNVTV
jgi:hypothetical protein